MRIRSDSGDAPAAVDIYWQDLTAAKQAEILRAFGDNGNWDVLPITTLGPFEEMEDLAGPDAAGAMNLEGM